MIRLRFQGVTENPHNIHLLLLAGVDRDVTIAILVTRTDIEAIRAGVTHEQPAQPSTHDLLLSILDETGTSLEAVHFVDQKRHSLGAKLFLTSHGRVSQIEATAADAVILALRCNAPILLREEILENAGYAVPQTSPGGLRTAGKSADAERADFSDQAIKAAIDELFEQLQTDDVDDVTGTVQERLAKLTGLMRQAAELECYEKAGRIKEVINKMKTARMTPRPPQTPES